MLIQPERYSSRVDLKLYAGGQVFDVAQTGPDSFILREPFLFPSMRATLVISVDGEVEEFQIRLEPNGTPSREIFYQDMACH
jgi:hypothetical protein